MALLGGGIWVPPRLWHASTIRCNYYWYSSSSLSVPALRLALGRSPSRRTGIVRRRALQILTFPIELLFETGQTHMGFYQEKGAI